MNLPLDVIPENENVKYQQSSFLRGFCREIACSSLRVFRVDSVKGLCVLHFAWLLLLLVFYRRFFNLLTFYSKKKKYKIIVEICVQSVYQKKSRFVNQS